VFQQTLLFRNAGQRPRLCCGWKRKHAKKRSAADPFAASSIQGHQESRGREGASCEPESRRSKFCRNGDSAGSVRCARCSRTSAQQAHNLALSSVLKDFKAAKDRSDPVYFGGPVDTPSIFALCQSPAKIEGGEHIFDKVYLISAKPVFEQTISTRPDASVFHVYLGYAGWTKDQLRREVALGSWFVFPADASAVFNSDPNTLWPQMIRKTDLKFARSGPVD